MRAKILAGTTSYSAPIFVTNSAVGGGLGSLVFNTSGLVGEYRRKGSSAWTAITLVTATLGTFASGGWIADGGLTGAYEVGIPDAALASGQPWVAVRFYGAANMSPVLIYIELDAVNYQSTSLGLALAKTTNITGFNDIAATSIVSAGAITTSSGAVSSVTNVTGGVAGSVGSVTGNVGGNVSGSVGSVVGNVGGNVTGSVGSVLGVSFPANFGSLSIDSNGNVKIQGSIKKNTALNGFPFYLALASDHVSPATGKTVTATRALDGGAFASCANAVTEISNGWYEINLAAGDLNGNTVALSFSAALCDTSIITVVTQP